MAYITENSHTQTVGGNKNFRVDFPFLARTDIKVQLNGVTQTVTNDYTIDEISGHTTVIFNTAPPTSPAATIRLFRDTDIDAIEATYVPGSSIRAGDLNNNNTQLLYAAQEFGTLKEDTSVSFTLGNKGDVSVNSSTDWSLNANSVELANMANNSVDTNELVNDAVTVDKVADNAIKTSHIQTNAITNAKMADDSVNTAELIDEAVTRAKVTPGGFNPVGTVIWYAGSTAPAGYLKANGDGIANGSGTTQGITANFSELYAVVGSTLPDLRGEFIRGLDDGRGVDAGRSIRSAQADQNKAHGHSVSATTSIANDTHTHDTKLDDNRVFGFTQDGDSTDGETSPYGNPGGIPGWDIPAQLNASDTHNHTATTTISQSNEGGTEARPRNFALLACIKY
jgi:hypothetical protein